MSVVIAIPTFSGEVRSECMMSTLTVTHLLQARKIRYEVCILSHCAILSMARNTLTEMFMQIGYEDLFFIDADVGFNAEAFFTILDRPEKVVAGVYPLKTDAGGYPVKIKVVDGVPIGRDGLIEADLLPTGFMRIKRIVIERLQAAYPELKYTSNHVHVEHSGVKEAYDLFGMGVRNGKTFTTEDYAFCQRWTDIKGQLWVYPDIDFSHVGTKIYRGNYHQSLLDRSKEVA